MSKFKVGDKVRIIDFPDDWNPRYRALIGIHATITHDDHSDRPYKLDYDGVDGIENGVYLREQDLELINNNNNMSLKTLYDEFTMTEPEKTLKSEGYLNDDGSLSSEGKVLFDQFVFAKFKDEFVENIVKPLKKYKESKDKKSKDE